MPKILILYTKIGGGHKSTAESVCAELKNSLGESVTIQMLDMLENNNEINSGTKRINIGRILEDNYTFSTTKLPFLWSLTVIILKLKWIVKLCYWLFETKFSYNIDGAIIRFQPDIVICTYYGGAEYIAKNFKIKTFTVVSDIFTPHPAWFRQDTDNNYLVLSDQAKSIGIKQGAKNIHNIGLCFNDKFQQKMTNDQILDFKRSNNIDLDKKLILAIGGGSGFPKAKKLLQEYLKSYIDAQLVIICGRDENLKTELETELENIVVKSNKSNIRILGFSTQVYEWINCTDIVIAKSGPATILEVVALNKPLFLIHYIWEQEQGNMQWIVNNNLGIYEPNPRLMIEQIQQYLKGNIHFDQLEIKNNLSEISRIVDGI